MTTTASTAAAPGPGAASPATVVTTRAPAPTTAAALRGELRPRTAAGRAFAAAVDAAAPVVAAGVAERDSTGAYPHDGLAELRSRGALAAAIPEELGGLGVGSVHDLVVGAVRLARVDPSLAIGVNMHLVLTHAVARRWRAATAAGNAAAVDGLGGSLAWLAASGAAVAAAVSEPAPQDLSRPTTTATRQADGGGWRIDGRKAFCTMSPAADLLSVAVSFTDAAGRDRYGFALVPTTAEGVTVHDDWDALGMRASGSGRVTLSAVAVGPDGITDSHPAGETSAAGLDRYLTSGLFHAAATLGIAEAAHGLVVGDERRREALAAGRALQQVAASVVDLAAMRATLAHAADRADEHLAAPPGREGDDAALARSADAFAQVQAAKALVDATGPRVVDRALELSGGAGYLAGHALARAYRDVRAGAFMHPLGANRAWDLIGLVELGRSPSVA